LAITWGGLGNYKKFPRGYCGRRRPRVLGGHPLDSWVSKEFLAQRLMRQESAVNHLNAMRLLKALVAAGALIDSIARGGGGKSWGPPRSRAYKNFASHVCTSRRSEILGATPVDAQAFTALAGASNRPIMHGWIA
jgi:hypothetical protein